VNHELLLHFLKFDIQTDSLNIKEWLEQLYVSNDLTRRFPDKLASLKLFVERRDAPQAARIRLPAHGIFAETNLCNGRCYYEGGRFFSANHGAYWHEMEYDLNTHMIRANIGGKYLASGQHVISNIIRPILQSFILPFYGLKTLHGAILNKGGRTIFLKGHGGMGKTTTAIQLMRAGYDLLSDDGPFFFTDDNYAYALSSLDYLHLTENTLRLFPELRAHVVGAKDNREKFAVRISDLQNGGAWMQPLQITDYIQLQRRHDVVILRLKKVNRNLAHRSLLDESMVIFRRAPFRASAYPFREYSEFVFDLLTKVLQGAETYNLEFADHQLSEIPALISQL
jgi:hypothetical protein